MNPVRTILSALVVTIVLVSGTPSGLAQEPEIDCRPVVENFRQNVESAPQHVLTLLEDVLIANGGHCVGQFVKVAIETSKADPETVKKIVFVSITNAEQQAPEIAEAAVAANPKYADAVREGFAEAFEDKNPRLQPKAPADQPAWAEENAPVPAPATIPAPSFTPEPQAIPRPLTTDVPLVATNEVPHNAPQNRRPDQGWDLLHDGVVDPINPADLAPPSASSGGTPPMDMAQVVEPEIPGKAPKKGFRLGLPKLPALPEFKLPEFKMPEFEMPKPKLPEFAMPELPEFAMPELPEAEEPMDLLLTGPFSGIPTFIEPETAPPPLN